MSTIRRMIVINPVEPSPLSFRAPMGVETWVDIDLKDQGGGPHTSGIGGQLMLTGRSTTQTSVFALVATDVTNGKTRAVLPVDTIQDPFGYQLRVFGTVDEQMQLLATGIVQPISAVTPEVLAPDIVDDIPLQMQYGIDTDLQVDLWADDSKTVPYDLSATVITATVWSDPTETLALAPFAVTIVDNNTVTMHLDKAAIATLPAACWWSLRAGFGLGITTLAHGDVAIVGTVTPPPPLITFTGTWDYQMPDQGSPNPGQIVQQNFIRNVLRISNTTSTSVDASATLGLLRAGDQIVSGTVTWAVVSTRAQSGFTDVTVSPLTQLAAAGVATFVISRP